MDTAGAGRQTRSSGVSLRQGPGGGHLHLAQPVREGLQGHPGQWSGQRSPAWPLPQVGGSCLPGTCLISLSLFRICKLLFYRIKPVFVFDGAPPQLKRETLARRRMKRSKESRVAKAASEKILTNYLQRQAVAQKLNRQTHAVENALKQGAQVDTPRESEVSHN